VKENTSLESSRTAWRNIANTRKEDLATSNAVGQQLANSALFLTDLLSKLDAIVLENDANSVDFINYVNEKAIFSNEELPTASYKYGQWQTIEEKTKKDYINLQVEMENEVNSLNN